MTAVLNPLHQATHIINRAFDDANPIVDLSNLNLTCLPCRIQDLQYLVIIGTTSDVCLFLAGNQLQVVPPVLMMCRNLTVLSLSNSSYSLMDNL